LVGLAPPTAVDLAFEVAVVAARVVFFLDGVIIILRGFFEEEFGKGRRDIEYRFKISQLKHQNMKENSWEIFPHH